MNLENIITSKAKFVCLRTIFDHQSPIHLRRIIKLTGLQPRSVQLALNSLNSLNILKKNKNQNRVEYSLNKNISYYSKIESFISTLENNTIKARSKNYPNLKHRLDFIDQARDMIFQMKTKNEIK